MTVFFDYELSNKQVTTAEVITTIGVILFVHAGLVLAFESGTNPDFQNFWDAFYYSIVALTTTGFGNTTPQTTMGRIVTSVGLIFAITIIPWLAFRRQKVGDNREVCSRCGESSHTEGSNYCHRCGYKMVQEE